MTDKNHRNDNFIISFSDIIAICRRNKAKIFYGMMICSILAVLNTLTNPIEYIAEATFRDKSRVNSAGSSLSFFLGSTGGGNDDSISLLKSRTVSEEIVRRLGYQATIHPANAPSSGYWSRIQGNVINEYALFNLWQHPSLDDITPTLQAHEVFYPEEVPSSLCIKFIDEETFELCDSKERQTGKLDVPFKGKNYEFTLVRLNNQSLKNQPFSISLSPLPKAANNIAKLLTVQPDVLDKNLISIKFSHRNRHTAVAVVNTLMLVYKDFLKAEQNRIIGSQIAYLEQRQDEIGDKLKEMMEGHITNLSDDMKNIGFANSKIAMDFLTETQNNFQQKLLNLDFEMKRLQKGNDDGYAYYDGHSIPGDPTIINHILTEKRNLKQQGDSLDLALRSSPSVDEIAAQQIFDTHIAHLDQNKRYREDANKILAEVDAGNIPPLDSKLSQDPKYLVKIWIQRLIDLSKTQENVADVKQCREQLCTYLTNLIHHFNVHETAIEERLAHQQNVDKEFDGIDLNTAKELYLMYTRQLNELEAQGLQHQFIVGKMENPEFEIGSLCMVLNDSISNQAIINVSRLGLELRDQNNRSLKEQERLKGEIDVQKRHLASHLKNAISLLKLKEDLTKYKIRALQSVTLGLIRQQITLLEQHLSEYISTRLKDLKQEMDIIEEHKIGLRVQMSNLPKKWVAEMLIDLQLDVNQKMIEEVSKLVESKIIGNNIDSGQSGPVDRAIAPIHAKPSRILFFAVLGAFLGSFLTTTFVLGREFVSGFHVSEENLKIEGQHVAGRLSTRHTPSETALLADQDLDTLRRVVGYLSSSNDTKSKTLLLAKGRGSDYSKNLALLFQKKGLRVLMMNVAFDLPAEADQLPGLLQYLEGEAAAPKIQHQKEGDSIAPGGISRFANELLGTAKFQALLEKLKSDYDWIIAVSHAMPEEAETEVLMRVFDATVVNVTDEKLNDLKACIDIGKNNPEKKVSFVMS